MIAKSTSVSDVLELNETLDRNDILGRISVQDQSGCNVSYNLTKKEWGYQIDYTVTDACGNVSAYTDEVSYLEYSFVGSNMITVNDMSNTEALKAGLSLKDTKGRTMSLPAEVQMVTQQLNELYYRVIYAYTYHSPLGKHTISFERVVMVGE